MPVCWQYHPPSIQKNKPESPLAEQPTVTRKKLELITRLPAKPSPDVPPLLFIHGAFCGAWCWEEHFLDWFAERGYAAHALSLSGHGRSEGRDHLDSLSIQDYVDDVSAVVAEMAEPPLLVGHSMGGFVVQKYLENHESPGAVLMCSVPPQGLMASALSVMFSRPGLFQDLNSLMVGGAASVESLRDALFAQEVTAEDLLRFLSLSQPESHRAIWDMMMFALPRLSRLQKVPILVLGAAHDHLIPPTAVAMTARTFGIEEEIFPGMGHGMMLEKDWALVAARIQAWITEIMRSKP